VVDFAEVERVVSGGHGGRDFVGLGVPALIVVMRVDDEPSVDVDKGVDSISLEDTSFVVDSVNSSVVFKSRISIVDDRDEPSIGVDIVGTV
jgi:hypothetical protein